ncbi:MAG: hypothetical protein ACREXJ_02085 [Gammaproteobacteria bacterium]
MTGPPYAEAHSALELLQAELEDHNQSAAASLAEGLEETLILHYLGVYGVLGASFKTTNRAARDGRLRRGTRKNCIESINALIEEHFAKVNAWKNSNQRHRWLGTALLDIEPRLRRVRGYRHLPKLRHALQRELKIRTTEGKIRRAA